MSQKIPAQIVDRVAATIDYYNLTTDTQHIAVALSGGKDSLLLTLILRQLGFEITPIVVDMGYESHWSRRIADTAATLDITPKIVSIRSPQHRRAYPVTTRHELEQNLRILDQSTSTAIGSGFTPCTSCYNSKVLSLNEELDRLEIERIAFGHHATDACASLLKAAFMYIDRWDCGNESYSSDNVRSLAKNFKLEALKRNNAATASLSSLEHRIDQLVHECAATTDEPPRQELLPGSKRTVIRPLFDILEKELIEVSEDSSLPVEGSGCGHSLAAARYTPREIIHFQILRELETDARVDFIQTWTKYALDKEGALRVNSRRQRSALLGTAYKPALDQLNKY